jgi:hypothetical protein
MGLEQPDRSKRPGIFVTDAEIPGSFAGPRGAYVVFPDTRSGEEVSLLMQASSPANRSRPPHNYCHAIGQPGSRPPIGAGEQATA